MTYEQAQKEREFNPRRYRDWAIVIFAFVFTGLIIWGIASLLIHIWTAPNRKYFIRDDQGGGFYTDTLQRLDADCILVDGFYVGDPAVRCGKFFVFDGTETNKRINDY